VARTEPLVVARRRSRSLRRIGLRLLLAALLLALGAWWVLADPVKIGPKLIGLTTTRGVDAIDLAVLPVLGIALWLLVGAFRPPAKARVRERRHADAPEIECAQLDAEPVRILVVCTANRTRSPIAANLLAGRLAAMGVPAEVRSAGTNAHADLPATGAAQATVEELEHHVSVPITPPMVERADLVLGLERHHVRAAVLLASNPQLVLGRSFTLKSLVALARQLGPRAANQPLDAWLAEVAARRSLADLGGTSGKDDLTDPVGAREHGRVVDEITAAVAELADLAWGNGRKSVPSQRSDRHQFAR
jgi:protein-tyrosine phosphatase